MKLARMLLACSAAAGLAACDGNSTALPEAPGAVPRAATSANQPPVAVINVDSTAFTANGTLYFLSSTGSYDPEGGALAYRWKSFSGCVGAASNDRSYYSVEVPIWINSCLVTLTVTDPQGATGQAGFVLHP